MEEGQWRLRQARGPDDLSLAKGAERFNEPEAFAAFRTVHNVPHNLETARSKGGARTQATSSRLSLQLSTPACNFRPAFQRPHLSGLKSALRTSIGSTHRWRSKPFAIIAR